MWHGLSRPVSSLLQHPARGAITRELVLKSGQAKAPPSGAFLGEPGQSPEAAPGRGDHRDAQTGREGRERKSSGL